MKRDIMEVTQRVAKYFKENLSLSKYEVEMVIRYSNHPDDNHLFMVLAEKENGTYTSWSCWNDDFCSLNSGHYDYKNKKDALKDMSLLIK